MRWRWRLVWWAFRFLFALAIVAVLGIAYLFWRAMPAYSGAEKLPGLSAEVRVWRDNYGVPHIFAASPDDAARAIGYLHASERLFQMEALRRAGQGRTAEVFGPDLVHVDKFMRTLGVYRAAQSSFAALSPSAQRRLQAYADGVNAYLASHANALPPEFLLVGDHPEPWTPPDSLVMGKIQSYQLSHNYEIEALRARLREKFGVETAGWLLPGTKPGDPITTEPAIGSNHAETDGVRERIGVLTGISHGTSNEWVIGGARTVTGKPILANDPHLDLSAPIIWYLVRVVTPDGSIEGATLPGAPVVILGQNDSIAWGFTTANTDVQDLFVETVDPSDPSKYLTPDGAKPFETREETIRVKDAPDIKLPIRSTRHGPVMSDASEDLAGLATPGRVIALAFTGLGDRDTTVEAIMQLDDARNWQEFLDAMRRYQTPTQNIVYADTSGDIGFMSPGLVPVRKSGDGLAPVDGASGAFDWVGTVPFEKWPQLHNPSVGFVFNANNANVRDDHQPTFGQDWAEPYRARRIQQFFDIIDKHSLDTSAAMQADHLSLAAKDLQPFIATITPSDERARQAQAMLASWDGVMNEDRVEPLIFSAFLRSLHRILLDDKAGVEVDADGPLAASTLVSLMRDHKSWCNAPEKPDPDCRIALARALDEGLALLVKRNGADMTKWRWGDEHRAVLRHQVFSHVPLLDSMSQIGGPASGGFYTLDRGESFDPPTDRPFARTYGGGFRGLYDLADPAKSRFMIATGQSGHIFSRHYRDLYPLWNDVKSFPLTGTEEELKKVGAQELTLSP